MKPIQILHNVPTIGKNSLGGGQIAMNLAKAQYALISDVTIWCLDNDENIKWASEMFGFPADRIRGFKLLGPRGLWFSPAMIKEAVNKNIGNFDVIHQHGIWTGGSSATLSFAKKKNIPTIIAAHGSLSSAGLNLSKWKKNIALTIYEGENLRSASCLHATSEKEIADYRNFGLTNPIAIIPNGIPENYLSIEGNPVRFLKQYDISSNKRILLFLARISPLKGLPMLINAISSISDDFSGWQLIIAGIDEFNHMKDVELLIKNLMLEDSIKIIGPLFGQIKSDAFAAAELFILSSHSEGAPMVVLDSLAAGVPVITTKASSWDELNVYNCGWWTEISTTAIEKALRDAVNRPKEDLQRMGKEGKKLIALKYTLPAMAHKTLLLYNWLLGKEDKPDFVILN